LYGNLRANGVLRLLGARLTAATPPSSVESRIWATTGQPPLAPPPMEPGSSTSKEGNSIDCKALRSKKYHATGPRGPTTSVRAEEPERSDACSQTSGSNVRFLPGSPIRGALPGSTAIRPSRSGRAINAMSLPPLIAASRAQVTRTDRRAGNATLIVHALSCLACRLRSRYPSACCRNASLMFSRFLITMLWITFFTRGPSVGTLYS